MLSNPISLIIANGHPNMASDIVRDLGDHTDIDIVLACSSGRIVAAAIKQFVPDVALLDIEISDLNLLDILSRIAADGLKTKVVCLTGSALDGRLTTAIAMGAKGILSKQAAPQNVVDCIRDVFYGENCLPSSFFDAQPEREMRPRRQGKRAVKALTVRERQIALLVCDGLSNKQLGEQLNLTEGTVKVHLHKIYRKLGLRNRAALSALMVTSRVSLKSRRGKRSEVAGDAKIEEFDV
jgi:two-component system, NarL family, nitrate/nitrite response regulator NarL